MPHVIGIDLGTTNSVVAFLEGGRPVVIPNAEGGKTTPSVVLYRAGEDPVVGELAKRQLVVEPARAIRSVKRLIGRRFSEVESLRDRLAYETVASENDEVGIVIDGRQLSPVDVSCHILQKMKETAAEYLGEEADQAVITVPAHFNDSQRQATKSAAIQAGFDVLRIINEPTAAALAYGVKSEDSGLIAVFDFGGGTFDISILDIEEDVYEVSSTNGDTDLGGDCIDDVLTEAIRQWIEEESGVDPAGDAASLQRIREAAEKTKCELSTLQATLISLPFIAAGKDGPVHFNREIGREAFEAMIAPVLERLKLPCRRALADAGLSPEDVDRVILVGGSTRIPAVQRLVKEFFFKAPEKSVNPDEAVAAGAALQAGVISGDIEEILLLDVTPLSLGIELEGGISRTLIPRNSSIPTAVSQSFTTTRDNQPSVSIHVLQGERAVASENRTLARLRLTEITPAPAEVPEIEVRFAVDSDGILSVSATDVTTGQQQSIVVEAYTAAKTSEVDRLIADAQEHQEEDREFLHQAAYKKKVMITAENMRSFLETNEEEIAEEDAEAIRHGLFRLDVAAHAGDLHAMLEIESELLKIGGQYPELFLAHRLMDGLGE
jgi:molecular chaperone DnaK